MQWDGQHNLAVRDRGTNFFGHMYCSQQGAFPVAGRTGATLLAGIGDEHLVMAVGAAARAKPSCRLPTTTKYWFDGTSASIITKSANSMCKAISRAQTLETIEKRCEVTSFLRIIVLAGLMVDFSVTVGLSQTVFGQENAANHWAFRKLAQPTPPKATRAGRTRTSIDQFVLANLEERGLSFSPHADRVTLIRRASLDLIGLLPSPKEVDEFLADAAPDAYERLIDRLLASPLFGERWGQHWLDVTGFVPDAPNSWKYRDYVIRAFNTDKPFDRFLLEQLAGDELVDWRGAEKITPKMEELLVATGYLRCARDLTGCDMSNIPEVRHSTLFDTIEIIGTGVLGLTFQCARCHDHKFDPIKQRDYYQIMALLIPAYNPEKWVQADERYVMDQKIKALYDVGPPPVTHILESGSFDSSGDEVSPGFVRSLSRSDEEALFQRSEAVGETSGRRLALAHWLTQPDAPASALVARVMVNRIWQHLFGRGIVSTPDNFGAGGSGPTHPGLIEHLAHDLAKGQWHRKRLVRRIMTSTVYRQASVAEFRLWNTDGNPRLAKQNPQFIDPENRLLWRMPLRRLESEIIRDAMLSVAGRLNLQSGGPPVALKPVAGGMLSIDEDKLSSAADGWRRSVYLKGVRVDGGSSPQPNTPLLSVFDQPILHTNCTSRKSSNVVLQSLSLLNDEFVIEQAGAFAQRVLRTAGPTPRAQINLAFRIALSRPPEVDEVAWSESLLADQADTVGKSVTSEQANHQALASLCHALLGSNSFLYVE